VIMV